MPRSTTPVTYGPEYEQLLLTAHMMCTQGGEGLYQVKFRDSSNAQAIKSKTYAYFKALRRDGGRADLIQLADQLSMRVLDGAILEFFLRANAWDAVSIRTALGLDKNFAEFGGIAIVNPPSAQTLLTQKLAEIREAKNSKH